MLKQFQNSRINQVYVLVTLVLIVKLCLLPFSQTVHPDAVSRIFDSIEWYNDPHWILSGAWTPLHFYLNGFALSIWNNPIYAPKLLNIGFSCLMLIPFFSFVRREFNENGALIATIFLAICPILFRNSFQALAGTPYLFFVVLSINWLSKGLKERNLWYPAMAGMAMTFAAGIRYEAWLLMMIFWLIIIYKREWRHSFTYGCIAAIFPVIWLTTNWIETGDPMFGINGNYFWTLDVMNNNASLNFESHLRRLWFFPFSLIIALGPPAAYVTLKMIFTSYKNHKSAAVWSFPFWVVLAFFIYNCSKGVLLLQHRFVGTLLILALPFLALYFEKLTVRKQMIALIFGLVTVGMSFIYNTDGVTPLPRLSNQDIVAIAKIADDNLDQESGLILDYIGWESTFFIKLHSGLSRKSISLAEGPTDKNLMFGDIKNILERFDKGVVLIEHGSKFSALLGPKIDLSVCYDKFQFSTSEIYSDDVHTLYTWKRI